MIIMSMSALSYANVEEERSVAISSNELSAIFPMHDVLIFFRLKFVDSMV